LKQSIPWDRKGPPWGRVTTQTFVHGEREGAYMLHFTDFPEARRDDALVQKFLDQAVQDTVVTGKGTMVHVVDGTIRSTRSIRLAGKYPGRELKADVVPGTQMVLRARL
jgi:hypothetical protein